MNNVAEDIKDLQENYAAAQCEFEKLDLICNFAKKHGLYDHPYKQVRQIADGTVTVSQLDKIFAEEETSNE